MEEQMIRSKKSGESRTEQVHILSLSDMNGASRLFGGKLMGWIDEVAAVTARRHSGKNVTTAVVDSLQFKRPAFANDTLVLSGEVTFTGKASMEICVKTYVEDLNEMKTLINTAYVVMVAIDEEGKPTAVPQLLPETEEEKAEWKEAEKRNALRVKRRNENY